MYGDQFLYCFIGCWYLDSWFRIIVFGKGNETDDNFNLRGRNGFDRVVQGFRVQADENLISKKLIANNNYYYEQAIAA